MFRTTYLLFILWMFIFTNCKSDSSSSIPIKEEISCNDLRESMSDELTKYENIVVVLCDLTASLGNASIQKVIHNASRVLEKIPHGTRVAYLVIQDGSNVIPVLEHTVIREASKQYMRVNNNRFISCVRDSLVDLLNKKIKNDSIRFINSAQSCISRGIKSADIYFRTYGENRNSNLYKFHTIILSDMIEECNSSILGSKKVFMWEKYLNGISSLLDKDKVEIDMSYSKLSIILTTDKSYSGGKFIKNEDLENLWKKILQNFNFEKDQINSCIPFQTVVPPVINM